MTSQLEKLARSLSMSQIKEITFDKKNLSAYVRQVAKDSTRSHCVYIDGSTYLAATPLDSNKTCPDEPDLLIHVPDLLIENPGEENKLTFKSTNEVLIFSLKLSTSHTRPINHVYRHHHPPSIDKRANTGINIHAQNDLIQIGSDLFDGAKEQRTYLLSR